MTSTYIKDGFMFFKETQFPNRILSDRLIFDSTRESMCIDYINQNQIRSITINPTFFKVKTLDFFKYIPNIEALYLLQDDLNIPCIEFLENLKILRMNNGKGILDLSKFKNLGILGFTHGKNIMNVSLCKKLFWIWIDKYKKDDLYELRDLLELQYLNLYQSSIVSLTGIENLRELRFIRLDNMPKLESLRGLTQNLTCLQSLDIYGAKRLIDYSDITTLKSLTNLDLRKTGDIQSINFVKDFINLKKITLGLKVLDGNMSILKGIQSVGFINYPHYNHKMKYFQNN